MHLSLQRTAVYWLWTELCIAHSLRVLPALFIRHGKIVTMVRNYENKQQLEKSRCISHLRRFSAFLFHTPYIRLWSATDLARRSVHFIFLQFHVNVYSIAFEFDLSIYCIGFRVEIFIASMLHVLCSTFERINFFISCRRSWQTEVVSCIFIHFRNFMRIKIYRRSSDATVTSLFHIYATNWEVNVFDVALKWTPSESIETMCRLNSR